MYCWICTIIFFSRSPKGSWKQGGAQDLGTMAGCMAGPRQLQDPRHQSSGSINFSHWLSKADEGTQPLTQQGLGVSSSTQ